MCVINQHLRKMLWGFKSKYDFLLRNRTLISYMSSYEGTGNKSMFITHFGRHNKWIGKEIIFQYSMKYEILLWKSCQLLLPLLHFFFLITCCPKNTLICKLDLVYRYIVYNEKTRLYSHYKPFYTHFAEIKMVYQIILL